MTATNTPPTRYTVTEKFQADQTAVWTARVGRSVAVKVVSPQENGMWDTDLLRKALAEHAGVEMEHVRPRRTPSDRQVAPRVWEVNAPQAEEAAPVAEEAEEPTPVTAEDVENVDYRMFVGVLLEDAKDMGLVTADGVRAAITNNAEQGYRAVRTEDGMIHVYYSWFVPQRAAVVEEAAPAVDTPATGTAWGIPDPTATNAAITADYQREAAELLGEGAQWDRHWKRGGDSAVIPVDREGALNIIVQALRHGGWMLGRRDGGVTLVSPDGESHYWFKPIEEEPEPAPVAEAPEEEIAPTPRTVYVCALASPVRGDTMAGERVRTEFVREFIRTEARREVKAVRIGNEGIIRVGSLMFIPQGLAQGAPASVPQSADPAEAVNLAARFLPQEEEGTRPCVEVGGAQVYAYWAEGALSVSVDLDTVAESLVRKDGTVPMVIGVQGHDVFKG